MPPGSRDETERHLRQGDAGIGRRDDPTGERGQLDPGSDAGAVQAHGHPVGDPGDGAADALLEPQQVGRRRIGERPELVEVAPGAEVGARAGQLHRRDRRVEEREGEGIDQGVAHGGVERVALLRSGEGDAEPVAFPIERDRGLRVRPGPHGPRRQPGRELGAGLEGGVDGGLGGEAVVDRPGRSAAEEAGEGSRRDRVLSDGSGDGVDRRILRADDHVAAGDRGVGQGVGRLGGADDDGADTTVQRR